MKISLNHETHTYTDTSGQKYKSVSSLIDQFVPFFDFEQKSYDYSVKHGIPVEEVRSNWREKNKLSTVYGKKIHSKIEQLIKEKTYEHTDEVFDSILKQVKSYIEKDTKILSEKIIHSEQYKVAGTSDLILDRKQDFDVIDFKTNKKIKVESPFQEKLLFPISHLDNAEFFKYALQLSLYGYMYEKLTKKRLYRLIMFWFKRPDPDNYDIIDGKWIKYSLPYLKEEAKLVLEYGSSK